MGEGGYLHLGHFGICGDVAVVFVGELGFSLAEVFASGVEGGFGHGCRIKRLVGILTEMDVNCVITFGVLSYLLNELFGIVKIVRAFRALNLSESL